MNQSYMLRPVRTMSGNLHIMSNVLAHIDFARRVGPSKMPFHEGNGRAARILAIRMALQAGLPSLDFSLIAEQKTQE